MADFKKAWAITSTWEGIWKPYDKRDVKSDAGDYMPFNKINQKYYTGTTYGLTAQFLQNYRNMADSLIPKTLKNLTEPESATIWEETRWKWMRRNDIVDQSVANLIFDFFVQSDIAAINKIVNVLLAIYKKPSFKYKFDDLRQKYKYGIEIAPNHREPTGGFSGLTELAIQLINNAQTQEVLFNEIKKARKSLVPSSRTNAFFYNNIQTRAMYEAKKGLKIKKQADLSADTEGSYGNYIAGAFALWIGYKWFKNRKKR